MDGRADTQCWDGSKAAFARLVRLGWSFVGGGEGDNSWETGKSKVVGDRRRTGNSARKAASPLPVLRCCLLPASEGTRDQTRARQGKNNSTRGRCSMPHATSRAPPGHGGAGQWGPGLAGLGWLRRRGLRGGGIGPSGRRGWLAGCRLLACARCCPSLNSHGRVGETSGIHAVTGYF